MKGFVIIFSLIAVSCCSRFVIEPKKYFEEIYDNLVAKLFAEHGTLKLIDFDDILKISLMNKMLDGSVNFHSGFVNRIGKLELNEQKYKELWNDTHVS